MDQVIALRPFVPARDFTLSKRFCQAFGFRLLHDGGDVAVMKLGGFSFPLQNFDVQAVEGMMVHLMVRDADAWWRELGTDALVRDFGVTPPRVPAIQPWGLKVGFLSDPSGVLWHVAEAPF